MPPNGRFCFSFIIRLFFQEISPTVVLKASCLMCNRLIWSHISLRTSSHVECLQVQGCMRIWIIFLEPEDIKYFTRKASNDSGEKSTNNGVVFVAVHIIHHNVKRSGIIVRVQDSVTALNECLINVRGCWWGLNLDIQSAVWRAVSGPAAPTGEGVIQWRGIMGRVMQLTNCCNVV